MIAFAFGTLKLHRVQANYQPENERSAALLKRLGFQIEGHARDYLFLNGGLFPETHRPVLMQKLLLSPLGWMIGRAFSRDALVKSFRQVFGPQTRPSESELDDFWSLIDSNHGTRVLHKLINYVPQRRAQRDRWVSAMQSAGVPLT